MSRIYEELAAAELRANGGLKCCPQCNRMLPAAKVLRIPNARGVSMRCIDCMNKAAQHKRAAGKTP